MLSNYTFGSCAVDEAEHRQYEEWLLHTQQLLQMQLKFLEEQIGVHRKSRKALCAKQRTAKKAGREFPEADAEKLKRVTEQQSKIQKQLDQVRFDDERFFSSNVDLVQYLPLLP